MHLENETAFNSHFSKNPVGEKVVKAAVLGGTAGGAIAVTAATTAAGAGVAGVASLFSGVPVIGGFASGIVASAASAAAVAALPVVVGVALGVGVTTFFVQQKKKKISTAGALDGVAGVVGELVFLLAFDVVNNNPDDENLVENLRENIKEWGYTQAYTDDLIRRNLKKSSDNLKTVFERELSIIGKLDEKADYEFEGKSTPYGKYNLPVQAMQSLAQVEANKLTVHL